MTLMIQRPAEFRHLNRLLDLASGDWPFATGAAWTPIRRPATDIFETESEVKIQVELPGMTANDVQLTLENGTLTIRGEKAFDSDLKEEQFHRIERRYGTFSRSFSLPPTVDPGKVAAEYKNGVLTIKLPVREEAKPRQIKVDVTA